jgi:superfamily I DNA and RNA helicase
MPSSRASSLADDSDTEAVLIRRHDVSNYNPEQILPVSPKSIREIRAWLKPTSYDIAGGEYRRHRASHVAGTGAWLISSDTYQTWLQSNDDGLLWIRGIPGSGKSVMAAQLVDELTKAHPDAPVLFFFFR